MRKQNIIKNIKKFQAIKVDEAWLKNGEESLGRFMEDNPVRKDLDARLNRQTAFKKLIFKPMPIAIIAMITSLLTGGGLVAASQNSLPTDKLYPVKLAWEKVEEKTTINDLKRVDLQTRLADKRLAEIKDLQARGLATKNVVENNLRQYQRNLDKAQSYLEDINQEKETSLPSVLVASINLEKSVDNQQAIIKTLEDAAPVEYKKTLADNRATALNNTDQSLRKLRVAIIQDGLPVAASEKDKNAIPDTKDDKVGQADKNGCIPSAGYVWCASQNKCLRPWEEKCPNKIEEDNKNEDLEKKQIPDIIDEEKAMQIAYQAGLKKGIKAWKANLYWYYGKINSYVWSVSNRLTETSGQTVIIDAKTGKVYQITDYQRVIHSVPTEPQEKPDEPRSIKPVCPKYIDCVPVPIINNGVQVNNCKIPEGCEQITQVIK